MLTSRPFWLKKRKKNTLEIHEQFFELRHLLGLKVNNNKKEGGQEGDSNSAFVWHCGNRVLFSI
jgi:hypothetical protein